MAVETETPTVTFKGASGRTYTFYMYVLGTEFRSLGGVYVAMRDDRSQLTVIYIGQTGNLAERFEDHHKWGCVMRQCADRIAVLVESDDARRRYIESDLIANYDPPCNG